MNKRERENFEAKEDEQTEIIRELRDLPPVHYLFKIENFSYLSNSKTKYFESSDFEVAGYKWRLRLCLYPNGNKNLVKEKGHISLYLLLSNSNSLALEKEVNVNFKLFVYNQIQDKYMTVQDAKGRVKRFRGMKKEWGFDQLLPLNVFNDPLNGYLMNDSCIFGAELFVLDSVSRKGESAYVVNELVDNTYTWKLETFENLKEEHYTSEVFAIGGRKWCLKLYPNGDSFYGSAKGNYLSAYLHLEDSGALNPGENLNVEYIVRVKDQLRGKHHELFVANRHFSVSSKSWGFSMFMPISKLNDTSNGYIINGSMILELQITLLTMVKEMA